MYLPSTTAQVVPPQARSTIFLSFNDSYLRCLGTFNCISSVTALNCAYSELPQPNRSPFSKKRKFIIVIL